MPQIKSQITAWIRAYRPLALVNIQFPLLLGAAMAGHLVTFDTLHIMVYGLFLQGLIVFWNDAADADADALNETPTVFSGGSRVIQDGRLDRDQLLRAGWIAGAAALASMLPVCWRFPHMIALVLAGPVLVWMYSFPPFRLNYSSGGELLQSLGCGAILPALGGWPAWPTLFLYNYGWAEIGSANTYTETTVGARLILAYLFLQLGAAIAFALPDREADRRAGKNTFVVRRGLRRAKALIVILGWGALTLLLVHAELHTDEWLIALAIYGGLLAGFWVTWRFELLFVSYVVSLPVLFAVVFILPHLPPLF